MNKFKKPIIIISILAAIIALPIIMLQVRNSQDSRSGASAGTVTYSFVEASKNVASGQEFTVDVHLNTGGMAVEGVDFTVSYPGNTAEFIEFTPISALSSAQFPAPADNGSQKFYRFGGFTGSTNAINGANQKIGTIKMKVKPTTTSGTIQLKFSAGKSSNSQDANLTTVSAAQGNYTVGSGSNSGGVNFFFDPQNRVTFSQQNFTVDVSVNTYNQNVEALDFTITYPTTYLELVGFQPVSKVSSVQAPNTTAGQYRFVGNTSSTSPVRGTTDKIGTFTFKAKAVGAGQVAFTQVKSGNPQTPVLTTTNGTPHLFQIEGGGTVTPTNTPTPTFAPGDTGMKFSYKLPGIGKTTGDNTNPARTSRTTTVSIYNSANAQVGSDRTATAVYDPATGLFNGQINLGTGFTTGSYQVKIKVDNSLIKRIPGIVTLTFGNPNNPTPQVTLVTGDIDQNNSLSIEDYNDIIQCFKGNTACTTQIKTIADLNEDRETVGDIDDFSILQRGFAIRQGD